MWLALQQFRRGEEEGDLNRGGFGGVGAVDVLRSMEAANCLRMVPSAALAGLVRPWCRATS